MEIVIGGEVCEFLFDGRFNEVRSLVDGGREIFVITDENVHLNYSELFKSFHVKVIRAGEAYKVQKTVDDIIQWLIEAGADRKCFLIGVGGGVITDLTGYVASVFLRGVDFGFVPTTLLGMVDAAIGGKNGIDVGQYKNMVGCINQPKFVLYDLDFLNTLPEDQWRNGFAEVIKHGLIRDKDLFDALAKTDMKAYQHDRKLLEKLILRNVLLKCDVVNRDVYEAGERKILNFGHTLGHAIEKQMGLMHGDAVAVGMVFAGKLSEKIKGFRKADELQETLKKYGLPVSCAYDNRKTFQIMVKDKKRVKDKIEFILLEEIGKAVTGHIELETLKALL